MINSKKKLLRKEFIQRRNNEITKNHTLIFKQVVIFLKKIINQNKFNRNLNVGIYWPLIGEVDLRPLKDSLELSFALPCSKNKGEILYRKWNNEPLMKDFYGIPAPLNGTLLEPKDISVILVPAIAIDKKGNRLGYGAGCFDLLRKDKSWQAIPSFVVLPQECVSSSPFPIDSWDIPFEGWITEYGMSHKNNECSS